MKTKSIINSNNKSINKIKGVKMLRKIIFGNLCALILWGCSSVSVMSDYDPNTDFSKHMTYSIYKGVVKDSKLEAAPLAKKRVLEAIYTEMQNKGLIETDSSKADLIVYAHAGTKEKVSLTDHGYGGWWGRPYGRDIDVSHHTEGALIIDLVDKSKNELVWRGIGTTALQDRGTPQERQKYIDEAVAKILEQYPPQK